MKKEFIELLESGATLEKLMYFSEKYGFKLTLLQDLAMIYYEIVKDDFEKSSNIWNDNFCCIEEVMQEYLNISILDKFAPKLDNQLYYAYKLSLYDYLEIVENDSNNKDALYVFYMLIKVVEKDFNDSEFWLATIYDILENWA